MEIYNVHNDAQLVKVEMDSKLKLEMGSSCVYLLKWYSKSVNIPLRLENSHGQIKTWNQGNTHCAFGKRLALLHFCHR